MDCDKDEYQCTVTLSTVFDPVNINPTHFLYDRNTVETLQELNPQTLPTIPQNRQTFLPTDVIPNVALRAEMRQYFAQILGTQYTGWEVIPDYPHLLSLPAIQELLARIRHCFPNEEEKLPEMSEESWSKAWKRLNYLRLNLQINPLNRQLFLSDEKSIKLLGKIISVSYSRFLKSEETALFHKESLRTIRVLDMSTAQLRVHLKPEDASQSSRFIQFFTRNLQSTVECFHSLSLGILSIVSSFLKPQQVSCVLEYLMTANPTALSSTSLKNIAKILNSFYAANSLAGDIQLILDMLKSLVSGLVQMFIYLLALFKSEDRLGVVEDALEALYLVLFLIDQILHGAQQVREPALVWSTDMNLLEVVQEMIKMEIDEDRNPAFVHLTEDHWLCLFSIANRLYRDAGTLNTMSEEHYRRLYWFSLTPVSLDSEQLTASVRKVLQEFHFL